MCVGGLVWTVTVIVLFSQITISLCNISLKHFKKQWYYIQYVAIIAGKLLKILHFHFQKCVFLKHFKLIFAPAILRSQKIKSFKWEIYFIEFNATCLSILTSLNFSLMNYLGPKIESFWRTKAQPNMFKNKQTSSYDCICINVEYMIEKYV